MNQKRNQTTTAFAKPDISQMRQIKIDKNTTVFTKRITASDDEIREKYDSRKRDYFTYIF